MPTKDRLFSSAFVSDNKIGGHGIELAIHTVKPCDSATKDTKKLLASVSTFASREFVLVEVAGVEPASQHS